MTAHDERNQQRTDATPDNIMTVQLPITLRQMHRDDLPKLEWYGEFKHFRNLFRRSFREQALGNRYLLVADCRGFPVGRLFVQLHSRHGGIADGHTRGYLYSFHVMEMFRGCGIGTRMIQAAEHILITRQFKKVSIAVAKENEGALRLYQRQGYRIYADDAGHWRYVDHRGVIQDVHEPCWLLEKMLT